MYTKGEELHYTKAIQSTDDTYEVVSLISYY